MGKKEDKKIEGVENSAAQVVKVENTEKAVKTEKSEKAEKVAKVAKVPKVEKVAKVVNTEKVEKKNKEKDSRKVNVKITPGNWKRIEKFMEDFNNNPERTSSKLKYTNIINDAISVFFEKKTT